MRPKLKVDQRVLDIVPNIKSHSWPFGRRRQGEKEAESDKGQQDEAKIGSQESGE